jgi:hypothetical protein
MLCAFSRAEEGSPTISPPCSPEDGAAAAAAGGSTTAKASAASPLALGDTVEANWGLAGTWYMGVVTAARPGKGTYRIQYYDGDEEEAVPRSEIRPVRSRRRAASAASSSDLPPPLKVAVASAATASAAPPPPTSGSSTAQTPAPPTARPTRKSSSRISSSTMAGAEQRHRRPSAPASLDFRVGDRVQAFNSKGFMYLATVAAVHVHSGEYTLDWDDCDPNNRRVVASNVYPTLPGKSGQSSRDRVKMARQREAAAAAAQEEEAAKAATVAAAAAEAATRGSASAAGAPSMAAGPEDTRTTTAAGFAVGDKVEANWKSTGTYYMGVVTAVDGVDGTYCIQYVDGDSESGVADDDVRAVQPRRRAAATAAPQPPPPSCRVPSAARASSARQAKADQVAPAPGPAAAPRRRGRPAAEGAEGPAAAKKRKAGPAAGGAGAGAGAGGGGGPSSAAGLGSASAVPLHTQLQVWQGSEPILSAEALDSHRRSSAGGGGGGGESLPCLAANGQQGGGWGGAGRRVHCLRLSAPFRGAIGSPCLGVCTHCGPIAALCLRRAARRASAGEFHDVFGSTLSPQRQNERLGRRSISNSQSSMISIPGVHSETPYYYRRQKPRFDAQEQYQLRVQIFMFRTVDWLRFAYVSWTIFTIMITCSSSELWIG